MENSENRTKKVFQANIADVSLSHLIELILALGSYKDGLVLVGGWAPFFLLQEFQPEGRDFSHIGSKDIDIAVDPRIVDEKKYAKIIELIQSRGYEKKAGSTFSFIKKVQTNDGEDQIQIDFLGPEYGGTPKNKRHQVIQDDFFLRKAHGADIVFEHANTIELIGKLPNGAEGKTTIKVADIVGIMTMKGIVIGSRYKEKDAYDIYSLILHYKDGAASVAEELKPHTGHGLVKESIAAIQDKFRSREAEGPSWVADFFELSGEPREQILTQAYLEVQRFLIGLFEDKKTQRKSANISEILPNEFPILDITTDIGGQGGSNGHFVHFQAMNIGEKVAIDVKWGIRGFGYEWRAPGTFVLPPGDKQRLEYKISDESIFKNFVQELNIFFEYKDNRGASYFTRRELVLKKVPSDAFYNVTGVGDFHPAVLLKDTQIRSISGPFLEGLIRKVTVGVEVSGKIKLIEIGISDLLLSFFKFSPEESQAAHVELVMRKVAQMLIKGNVKDYTFTADDLPKDHIPGFDAYIELRDSI